MLNQYKVEMMPEAVVQRLGKINTEYLKAIGERIKDVGRISKDDASLLQTVYKSGESIDVIRSHLEKASGKNAEDITAMFDKVAKRNYEFAKPFYEATGKEYIPYKDNEPLRRYVESVARQTVGEYTNMAQHTAFCVFDSKGAVVPSYFPSNGNKIPTSLSETYTRVTDLAIQKAQLGYSDYMTEMRGCIKSIADSGIRTVDYATGYSRRLDSAVRQNILWGLKECNQNSAKKIGEDFGADGYEIDYHSNPRPTHADMGGKQYAIGEAVTINGVYYPSIAEVQDLLDDYGCLHFCFPIVLGIDTPSYSDDQLDAYKEHDNRKIDFEGETYTPYEATQVQRQLETAMRVQEDRETIAKAAGDIDLQLEAQRRIGVLTEKYTTFSGAAKLPTKMERASMAEYKPKRS